MKKLENWYKELGKERKIFVYVISCLLLAAFGFGLIPFLILIYLELGIPNNNAKKIIGYFFAAPIALYLAGVTIAGVIWLNIEYPVVIFNEILAIPIYFLAKKLDNKHLIKQPDDRGYKWGYFQGITAIVWGAISLLIISGLWFYLRRPNLRLFIMLSGVLFSFVLVRFSAVGAEIMNYASLLKAENLGGYLGFLLQSDGIRLTPILYCQFLLLSLIGPLPSLIDSPSDYISLLAPYRYLKVMMSPLIYYGLFLFVKDKKSNLIVVVYVFLNFLGIWFAGFFLVDIFQFIFYPIFISAFMRALVEFNVFSKKYLIYVFCSLFLVIYWNAFV